MDFILKPNVGETEPMSSPLTRFTIVVLPALSSPTIRMRNSLSCALTFFITESKPIDGIAEPPGRQRSPVAVDIPVTTGTLNRNISTSSENYSDFHNKILRSIKINCYEGILNFIRVRHFFMYNDFNI